MVYVLLENKPDENLSLKGELFKYLVKVRRHNVGDTISFRSKENMKVLYNYKIDSIENRNLQLTKLDESISEIKSKKSLHIGWCIIDSKSIEKVLPSLSEIGVERISFINCDRSQKNFKIDYKRLDRILEASIQQCGRSSYIEFSEYKNIESFVTEFPNLKVFDFCEKVLDTSENIETILVGCEGGFSLDEKEFLKSKDVFRLDTPMILRSESAVMAVASKVLV